MSTTRSLHKALEERFQRESVEVLRRILAEQRASQRGPTLPPAPSPADRARSATSTPAERARVDVLLRRAGITQADLDRGSALLPDHTPVRPMPVVETTVDDLSRKRARALLRRRQ